MKTGRSCWNANIAGTLFVNPQERKRLDALLRDFGEVTDFEFQFRRRDGEIRTGLQESSFLTRDDAGAITGYQGFLLDVTDHKQAEFDIRRRNRELLALNAIAGQLSQSSTLEEGIAGTLLRVTKLFAADVGCVYLLDEPSRTLKLCASVGSEFETASPNAKFEIPGALLDQIRQTHALLAHRLFAAAGISRPASKRGHSGVAGGGAVGERPHYGDFNDWQPRDSGIFHRRIEPAFGGGELGIAGTIDKSLLLKPQKTREAYESLRHTRHGTAAAKRKDGRRGAVDFLSAWLTSSNNPLTAILGYSQLVAVVGIGGCAQRGLRGKAL